MRRARTLWALGFLVLAGCPSSDRDGRAAPGAGTGAAAGTGTVGGGGAGPAGADAGAGAGGTPQPSAGTSAAGSGGQAGSTAGTGAVAGAGAGGSAGAAGVAGCAQDIACKLTAPASTGDVRQDCVDRINQFRTQCACMTPLARWTEAEACADMMAEYDSMTGMAHSGFTSRVCTPGGNGQNECPGARSESSVVSSCLQQMWSEGPPPMSPCSGDCFQKYGHFLNMTNPKFKKVACGYFKTSSGSFWAVQNFSP